MQFPESWLRAFCNPPLNTQELADTLTLAGFEVEEMRPVAPAFTGIVVAEIVEAVQHPDADRLRVCKVNAGGTELLQIVCGAPNARVGIKVPLATVGAELPPGEDGKPFKIKVGKLRGVESFGMLCSARELGLSTDHGGLLELADDAAIGRDIRAQLNLDDQLLTLKLTPNLGHALSVMGVARELSALTGATLNLPAITPVAPQIDDKLKVHVRATDLCGRFAGRVVRGVNAKAQTPAWMVAALERCGQRPVSALVDISNYVMFELGRPSHMFDLDKIQGDLEVRWARTGETLKLLNGNTIELDEKVGVIADAVHVESLAGIMGGDSTAVSDDTQNLYIEAAFWWPESIQGRARRYNFSTDAAHRFERGVDAASIADHIERLTALVLEICGGHAGPLDDQVLNVPVAKPVRLRVARAAKVLGIDVTQAECVQVMQRLGFPFVQEEGALTVTPPSWRHDIQIEEDLIEEVIRVLGLHRLNDAPPLGPVRPVVRPERMRPLSQLRRQLCDLGYQETINFSFVEERWERELAGNADPIRVLNPIAAPLAVMRSSLMGSLIEALKHNLARRQTRARLFETGRVFLRNPAQADAELEVAGVHQPRRVSGLLYGAAERLQWSSKERAVDFFDAKGDVEMLLAPKQAQFVAAEHPALHPGRSARIECEGKVLGWVGELHPRWRQAYELPQAPVLFELDLAAVLHQRVPHGLPVPRHPASVRDVAVIVGEGATHDALMAAVNECGDAIVRSAQLFDVFKPSQPTADLKAGERSLALRLELQDEATTLTDERMEAAVQAVIRALQTQVGARLRGQ
ncbi:phenylalanine--tRNA ligase subunit beta [Inhella gelatinilytica]|uniref:Phenylalanine--tRNA ligase beta subunit n=1 Tax=Inhella gelatinilytica TaxID=2795030 RepID=A0A931IUR0_9BURK|nr:phenylalanine--tRNA ligase subunit beta [Inhella gelatinilytica]MBH9553147.1 phenylalanine--tRNA ligase subunit beta [Inhella gelatinilytica]